MFNFFSLEDNSSNPKYIKTLDGWRAVAIIAVLISHSKDIITEYTSNGTFLKGIAYGGKGVNLFFAISGFIIALKLFDELNKYKTINLKEFYKRRFFRLFPTIIVYLLFLIGLASLNYITLTNIELIASLLSFRNYIIIATHVSHTAPLWSLSVEEHFYFMLPSFLIFLRTSKNYLIGLVTAAFLITVWRKLGTMESFVNFFPYAEYKLWNTFGRLDGLINGVLLAYLYVYKNEFCKKYLSRIPSLAIIAILLIIFNFKIPLAPMWEAILFPLLIYSTFANPESQISRMLESRPLIFIGVISYSLYMWHSLFVFKMPAAPLFVQSLVGHWYSILLAVLVAFINYKLVETPMRDFYKTKKLKTSLVIEAVE